MKKSASAFAIACVLTGSPALAHDARCSGSIRDGGNIQSFSWESLNSTGTTGTLDYPSRAIRYLGRPLQVRGSFFKYEGRAGYTFYLKAVSCMGFDYPTENCVGPARSIESEAGADSVYLPLYVGTDKIGEITCEAFEN